MHNIRLFNVAPSMPQELAFLERLSYNLWWTWHPDAIELFRRIDPHLWKLTGHSPLRFFVHIPQKRLEALTEDDGFMSHLQQVKESFDAEIAPPSHEAAEAELRANCIAYFSLEYGLHESIRLYSGGLGCLAGDHLKGASDMGLPMVGVGLLYRQGYFQQYLNNDGWQQEAYPENEVHCLPVKKAYDPSGKPVQVKLSMPHHEMEATVWRMDVGRIPLFLLDTNIPENTPEYRRVTGSLYGGDREMRLRQELLLGIGGFRALLALGYSPAVCHMNEGHAAFASLAHLSYLMQTLKLDIDTALEVVPRTSVFTTHTPVPAGNETFPMDLAKKYLTALEGQLGVPADKAASWGAPPETAAAPEARPAELSMTVLGLRTAEWANAVSRLHGKVARAMWTHLWPGRPQDEIPIRHITNGIHISSWLSADNATLLNRYLGPDWLSRPADKETLARVDQIPAEELWHAHELGRSRLIRACRELGERQLTMRNATRAELAHVKSVFRHDALTIGFARRFASYKRATLLLKDPGRLEAMLNDRERPIQLVFAGKAHPADDPGKALIQQIVQFARRPGVRQHVIFVEDYDIRIARYLTQGADVWLNTPRRTQEASGTSGMKAALNGALHISVLDGWWDEGYSKDCGWSVGHGEDYDNPDFQDSVESQALYNLLENEVVPCFYDRPAGELPERWIAMMQASVRKALSYFVSNRMLAEYNEHAYRPALLAKQRLLADDAREARTLVKQHQRLRTMWKSVRIGLPNTDKDVSTLHVGDTFNVSAPVQLGALSPEEVEVQLYYGPVNADNQITESFSTTMLMAEQKGDGQHLYQQEIECRTTGRYGFTARVIPRGPYWDNVMPGFIAWANSI